MILTACEKTDVENGTINANAVFLTAQPQNGGFGYYIIEEQYQHTVVSAISQMNNAMIAGNIEEYNMIMNGLGLGMTIPAYSRNGLSMTIDMKPGTYILAAVGDINYVAQSSYFKGWYWQYQMVTVKSGETTTATFFFKDYEPK